MTSTAARSPAVVSDHRGPAGSTTMLEFTSSDPVSGERIVHSTLHDQAAYDAWHIALLTHEVLASRRCLREEAATLEDLPRPEKNLLVALALATRPDFRRVLELGSSLFELIDGYDAARHILSGSVDLPPSGDLAFTGVDISSTMCEAAVALHPDAHITTVDRADAVVGEFDLLYDRNVSSYAFTSATALGEYLGRAEVGLLNLFVTRDETFASARMGKTLTYFGLEELLAALDRPLFHLFGERAPGVDQSRGRPVIEGFFLVADLAFAEAWLALAEGDRDVARYLQSKRLRLTPAEQLIEG